MILADKIINERKKNGWSQEELADMLDVSRQSVSKWEGAQSVPDLNKILKLAEIFGVSTDYLLKDEMEPDGVSSYYNKEDSGMDRVRRVSMEEATEYIQLRKEHLPKIALGVLLYYGEDWMRVDDWVCDRGDDGFCMAYEVVEGEGGGCFCVETT